jgi:hypothetical protein
LVVAGRLLSDLLFDFAGRSQFGISLFLTLPNELGDYELFYFFLLHAINAVDCVFLLALEILEV